MSSVLLSVDDSIATITLNRPEALNSFDADMATAWRTATLAATSDPTVGAIIVRAEGRAFCAGGDIKAMYSMDDRGGFITELAQEINEGLLALIRCDKPVVAAAQGTTVGGGLGILLASDYAIVGESSKVGGLYDGVGLTPDLSVSYHLARAIGERRALALTLTPRMLTAEEALDWGLAAEVVPDGDIHARAVELARAWAGSAHAYGQAKRLIRAAAHAGVVEQLTDEAETIGQASMTPDSRARIEAFATR